AILGVAANASVQDIKKAYRALAHQYHPDRFRSELDTAGASEKMIEINEAFSVLSDAKRREAYDRERNGVKTPRPVVAPAPPDDWRDQIAPKKTVSNPQPSPPTSTVNQTVAKDFLSKIKAQVLQESTEKLQTENEPGWLWALSAKTWTANCWVGLRLVPDLNANVAKELTSQLESLIAKRESGWKKNF